MEIIAWIGSICFALSGLPQAIKSFQDGHSEGISWGLLWLWLIGEVCMMIYIFPKGDAPLLTNYALNFVFLCVIFRYKVTPRMQCEKIKNT